MKPYDLQFIVLVEAICLSLIVIIIVAAFKRWKGTLIISSLLATMAFFCAWSLIMAFGSMLVYGSASTLLWWQLENKNVSVTNHKKTMQKITWATLAIGVVILIVNNIRNIFLYLN